MHMLLHLARQNRRQTRLYGRAGHTAVTDFVTAL